MKLFLRHRNGSTHMLGERPTAKLKRELAAGRGGPEITRLVMSEYTGFLGPDGEEWPLDELRAEMIK